MLTMTTEKEISPRGAVPDYTKWVALIIMTQHYDTFSNLMIHSPCAGWLVVRQLPRRQPERLVPGRGAPILRGRGELVHLDRVQLQPQEDRHEDETTGQLQYF